MMPIYMDLYPRQRSQVPSGQCYYPSYDGIPPQTTMDQAKYPMMGGPWSNGSNYGHMIPCCACSNPGNLPVYYSFNPPTSHFPMSPFFHSCGHHPAFTSPYLVNYPLTSHHSVVQPAYGYDKGAQRDYHCCGCPDHICNQKSDKGVKIEEQEPEIARKKDSLAPIKLKSYPYPVMWVPPEYMKKNFEYGRPLESQVADQKNASHSTKSHEDMKSSEKGPGVWNDWFPLDLNRLKPSMHGEDMERTDNRLNEDRMREFTCPIIWVPSSNGKEEAQKDQGKMNGWFPIDINGHKSFMESEDGKGRQNQQVVDKRRQFPFPIIWMPSHSEQGQGEKKDERDSNAASIAKEPLSSLKFIPVKPSEIDDGKMESENNKNSGGHAKSSQTTENIANQELDSAKKVEVLRKADNSDETKKVYDGKMESENNKNSGGHAKSSQTTENSANQELDSVKKVEVLRKADNSDETKKVGNAPSKYTERVVTDNPTETSVRRQSSPQKTSKLPPVCLRVDPLSRKKNGNGSSRSPSPPGSDKREKAKDSPRASASSSLKENTLQGAKPQDGFLNKSKEVEPAEAERKVVDMADDKNNENKNEDWRSGSQRENSVRFPIELEGKTSRKSSTGGTEKDSYKLEEDKKVSDGGDMVGAKATGVTKTSHLAEAAEGEGLKMRKNLSDVKAAIHIQSAYRGFEVRKMEPLKKLKQMAEVRVQVAEIRDCIQALESSSDLQKNDRERNVIGEMIMRLLLKLDTIQGLHPSLRDIRKALARELVILQEKLDLLCTKKSKGATEVSVDPKIDTSGDVVMQEMQNKKAAIVENSVETSGGNSIKMREKNQSQLSQSSPNQCQDTSKLSLDDKVEHGRCDNEIKESFVVGDMDSQVAELTPNVQLEATAANGMLDAIETAKSETEETNGVHPELEQSVQLPIVSEEKTSSEVMMGAQSQESCYKTSGVEDEAKDARASDTLHVDDNLQVNELRELPIEMTEEHPAVSKLEEIKLTRKEGSEIEDGEMESNMLSGPNFSADVDNMMASEVEVDDKTAASEGPETNLLAEPPLGVTEEELAVSAFEEPETNRTAQLPMVVIEDGSAVSAFGEHEQIKAGKDEALCHGEAIDNVATNTTALMEAEDSKKVMLELEEFRGNMASELEKIQPLSATEEKEKSDEVAAVGERGQEMMDVDDVPSCESAVKNVVTEELEEKKEQIWEQKVNGNKEEKVLLDSQCEEVEYLIDENKVEDELPSEFESTEEDVLNATPTSQISNNEKDTVMERDNKLIEENAKLREMMEKLMEAGKEQLSVISGLTGRVKDLERKLSRNQKHGTRRYRKTQLTPSVAKLYNNSSKKRAANVAM